MLCNLCKDIGLHFDELFPRHTQDATTGEWPSEPSSNQSSNKRSKRTNRAKIHLGYKHHESFSDLKAAGKDGCELCSLIEVAVTAQVRDHGTQADQGNALSLLEQEMASMHIRAPWPFVGSVDSLRCTFPTFSQVRIADTKIRVFCDASDPAATKQISGRPINSRMSLDGFYNFATSQIENCRKTHRNFCTSLLDSTLPTRVIDVGCPKGIQDPFILETDGKSGTWVALSHQWGGKIPQRTTMINIQSRYHRLPLAELPLTFRDAIEITRGLGCRYLWIDALCIIQDSHEDWVLESQKMEQVYKHAYLTIACDMVENSESGILLRTPKPSSYVTLSYESHARGIKGNLSISLPTRYNPLGPLFSRGWTLQEDLLSTRLLHIDSEQLLWTCRSASASEENSTVPIADFDRVSFRTAFLKLIKQPWSPQSSLSWYLVVDDYVCRNLTDESDRLPAFSGIAREVSKHSGYAYKAGLWEEDMPRGLLWSSFGSTQNGPTGEAPSWSWAAMKFSPPSKANKGRGPYHQFAGMWKYDSIYRQSDAQIVAIDIIYADGDVHGRVSRGVLSIRGRCISATDLISGSTLPLYKSSDAELPSYTPTKRLTSPRDPKHIINELDHKTDWKKGWSEDEYCSWFETQVIYLQLAKLDGTSSGIPPKLYALILQPTGIPGEYRRRGIARIPEVDGMAEKGWEVQTITLL